MGSMTRAILDWTEDKLQALSEKECDEGLIKSDCVKAFGLGCIEGAIDSAVIWAPILLVSCAVKNKQLKKR